MRGSPSIAMRLTHPLNVNVSFHEGSRVFDITLVFSFCFVLPSFTLTLQYGSEEPLSTSLAARFRPDKTSTTSVRNCLTALLVSIFAAGAAAATRGAAVFSSGSTTTGRATSLSGSSPASAVWMMEWQCPHATHMASSEPSIPGEKSTFAGSACRSSRSSSSLCPSPSCPMNPRPHAYSRPPCDTAIMWQPPADTATHGSASIIETSFGVKTSSFCPCPSAQSPPDPHVYTIPESESATEQESPHETSFITIPVCSTR
mmetsp:Transcript_45591/g.108317  ORF Transcript_45591/g.108317 Transcript_45591/m.108317 type:complete len:258 (+) Transcript_45591:298-1071(+)